MVGRKTKFTTQNKITQGGRHGERKKKKNFVGHREKHYEGKKMEKKQTLKKSKMKVNQAEEKLIFHFFFILTLQFTAIR